MTLPAASLQNGQYIFIDDTSQPRGTFWQTDSAVTLFTLDYTNYLTSEEVIVSATYTISPTSVPPLTVSSSTVITASNVADGGLSILVGGGVIGQSYSISASATTNTEQVKVDTFAVQVTPVSSMGCFVGYPLGGCDCCTGATGATSGDTGGTGGGTGATGATGATGPSGGGDDDISGWATSQAEVGATASLIAAARSGRVSIVVTNKGTGPDAGSDLNIYVGPDDSVSTVTGLLIEPGDSLTLNSTTAVWGIAESLYEGSDDILVFVSETFVPEPV